MVDLVVEADEEGFKAGEDPRARHIGTAMRVMKRLGIVASIAGAGAPPVVERIHGVIGRLYRPEDLAIGGLHLGTFMFRDIFGLIRIPLGFGTMAVNPFHQTNFSETQLRWLASKPADMNAFYDQFADIFDFGWGFADLEHAPGANEGCKNFMELARFQLQAAAAAVSVAYDLRGAIQSALLGTELSLKAGLAAHGYDDAAFKAVSHNYMEAVEKLAEHETKIDLRRLQATVNNLPNLVPNRYSAQQPDRRETGRTIMGAQYVAGEVMRQFSDRDLRAGAPGLPPRFYPPV